MLSHVLKESLTPQQELETQVITEREHCTLYTFCIGGVLGITNKELIIVGILWLTEPSDEMIGNSMKRVIQKEWNHVTCDESSTILQWQLVG
jgi:hypothetical protein